MTIADKQAIAAAARVLIHLLNECDDPDYIDEVCNAVSDGEIYPSIDAEFI